MTTKDQKLHFVAINYSGGVQSEWLLWMVLLGLIERPKNFAVFNADPGMENSETYTHIKEMSDRCSLAGIEIVVTDSDNLYQDILAVKRRSKTRLDTPPFWTHGKGKSKTGNLKQACTKRYKVEPMDLAVRLHLEKKYGVPSKSSAAISNCVVENGLDLLLTSSPGLKL